MSRPCCCRRFSERFAPRACSIRANRPRSSRRLSAPVKTLHVQARRRACAPASCCSSSKTRDLAGAAAESRPRRLTCAEAQLRDNRERDGAGGAPEGGARRARRERCSRRRSRRSSTTVSGCTKEGAIAQKDVNDAQVNLSQARDQYETARKHLERPAEFRATIRRSRRPQRSATLAKAAATPRRRSSATRASPARSTASSPICRSMRAKRPQSGAPVVTVMDVSQVIARAHISPRKRRSSQVGNDGEPHRPGRRADRRRRSR